MNEITVAPKRECRQYSPSERTEIVGAVLAHMANGQSLISVSAQLGVDDATIIGWINEDPALEIEYDRLKLIRSRVLVEQALDTLESLGTDASLSPKAVDTIVRHKLRIAALLNPKEFSERMLSNPRAPGLGGNRPVSFTLNFGGAMPARESVTVTVNEHEE